MKKAKIALVGSFNVDITGYADRLPRGGETVFGHYASMGPGGKGFNQATAAARAGAEVTMIARIGKDAFSAFARQQFEREGLWQRYLSEDETESTGSALIEVDSQTGENRIIVVPGANHHIAKKDVYAAEREIAACDIALSQLETNLEAVSALKELAGKYKKPFVLNPAPYLALPEGFLDGVDLFTPNETEAEYFSGLRVESDEDIRCAARRLLCLGVRRVVITLGKRGAYYLEETGEGFVPSPVVKAVDTTGAGDAFNGALCVAMAEGKSLPAAMRLAVCFAALSVTKKGACAAMPDRAAAEALERRFFA